MLLVQKWPFFQLFFFRQYRPGKCLLPYSRTKKHLLGYKNTKFKKSKNWHFSKGVNPWFWSKNGHFSNVFLGSIGQENVFYDILEPKNTFLGYKNTKFKKSKNWRFSKGVNPWFWSKNGHFANIFFFRKYRPGKCLLRYSRTKNTFVGYRNKKFKKSKNWHFSHISGLTHGFGAKIDIFFNIFF